MREQLYDGLSLFNRSGSRKYLNAVECRRFIRAAARLPTTARLFCLTLLWSGARVSEGLALAPAAIDIESGTVSVRTLKRRKRGVIRQVPLPPEVLNALKRHFKLRQRQRDPQHAAKPLWRFSRTTAWRHVKKVMAAAGIVGAPAMPKGLRHGFGVKAFQSNVPTHLVQRWLGHASIKTTAIYGDVVGPDELAFAARMWGTKDHARPRRAQKMRRTEGNAATRKARLPQANARPGRSETSRREGL
jgi:integrase/recombinase XerD